MRIERRRSGRQQIGLASLELVLCIPIYVAILLLIYRLGEAGLHLIDDAITTRTAAWRQATLGAPCLPWPRDRGRARSLTVCRNDGEGVDRWSEQLGDSEPAEAFRSTLDDAATPARVVARTDTLMGFMNAGGWNGSESTLHFTTRYGLEVSALYEREDRRGRYDLRLGYDAYLHRRLDDRGLFGDYFPALEGR